jgi:hypothetical protein
MLTFAKTRLQNSTLYYPLRQLRSQGVATWWYLSGQRPPIPHWVKQRTIAAVAKRYGVDVLVESGTLYGDMPYALRNQFGAIFSIELSHELHVQAAHRLRGYPHIHLFHGDSGKVLTEWLPRLADRAVFWLDGHYSGGATAKGVLETPIVQELTAVLSANRDRPNNEHLILIDDARCFNGTNSYPTCAQLEDLVRKFSASYEIRVLAKDILCVAPV